MSQWAHNHPEEMAEIASLPLSQQNAALRHAIGYDPDAIRDEEEEREWQSEADREHREEEEHRQREPEE